VGLNEQSGAWSEQHSGIIAVMRVGLDGKMRPNAPPRPKLEDQTDELVASADSGVVEPTQMKIGLVVGEPKTSAELEAAYGAFRKSRRSSSRKMTRQPAHHHRRPRQDNRERCR
jgi:hypothetical protein